MQRMVCTPMEASKALATSPDTIRELIQSGEIPAYKQGRNYKIPVRLLENYIAERAIKETERRKNGE